MGGENDLRTKFTQNQKERMLEFAQRVEWRLQKRDEELVNEFCSKIGVEKRVFKIWLHNNKKNFATSTADMLPECLIQAILSLLSFEEAAKMSILSKTWLHAWKTLPALKFTIDFPDRSMKILDDIMERYQDGKIPIEKFEVSNSYFSSKSFRPMIDKWLRIALQNGVKDLVFGIHDFALYPLPIFEILAAKSLRELVLSDCDLMSRVSISNGLTNCKSLRNLSLDGVNLDENMLQTLLNSCPLIVNFNFKDCSGLEKIELLNLRRIESVSIRTQRQLNQLVKIQSPTLEHLSYTGLSKELEVVECQGLKSLELSSVTMSNGFLHSLISRCQSLEVLKIQDCKSIGEIDCSNLVSLEYIGYQIPQLKMAREPRQLKHSNIVLKCDSNLTVAWLCKLQKFLSTLTSWSQVSLYFSECYELTMKNLELHHRVATPHVGVLNVNIDPPAWGCPTFMDSLLWSCHPSRLYVNSTIEITQRLIGRLMHMKNSSYSTSHGSSTHQYSQLKDIKAFDGKNQPLELTSGGLAVSTLRTEKNIYFLLDW